MTNRILLALLFLSVTAAILIFTGCQSRGLAGTCSRFGMTTKEVLVYAVDSDELGASKTVTKFQCIPKKYKEK